MQAMPLLALTILLLFFREPVTAALNQWAGIRSWTSAGRGAAIRALGLLVIVALIFTLDPEIRAFLTFLDMFGVDIFLMLLFFQGREALWLGVALCAPAIRSLERWGWFPMPLPARAVLKQHPLWSLYATAQLAALAFLITFPVFTSIGSLANIWVYGI